MTAPYAFESRNELSTSKAKTTSRRIVPIQPSRQAWLEPVAKASGPVVPSYPGRQVLQNAMRLAAERGEIQWVRDGLRNSFCWLTSVEFSGDSNLRRTCPTELMTTRWVSAWWLVMLGDRRDPSTSKRFATNASRRGSPSSGFFHGRCVQSPPVASVMTVSGGSPGVSVWANRVVSGSWPPPAVA